MDVVNCPGVVSPPRVKRTVVLLVPGTSWAAVTEPNVLPLRSRVRSDACTVAGSTGLLKVRSTKVIGAATHSGPGEAETTARAGVVRSSSASRRRQRRGRLRPDHAERVMVG